MSLGIYPVFNPRVREAKFDGLGEILASQFDVLDELAKHNGSNHLTAFTDTREIPPDFNGPPEELEEVMGPWEDWFDCKDGRLAFESLAGFIAGNPAAARRLKGPEYVVEELQSLARALAVAERERAKFRLEMS